MHTDNVKQHWAQIHETKDEIRETPGAIGPEGEVYIVSEKDRARRIVGGRISVVTLDQAALHIAARTHKLATTEQIDGWKQEQAAKKKELERATAQKESKMNLDLAPFAELLLNYAAAQKAAPAANAVPVPAANHGKQRTSAPVAE